MWKRKEQGLIDGLRSQLFRMKGPAFTHEVKWPVLSEMTASSCRQLDFLEPRTLGAYKRDCFVPGTSSNYLTAKAASFINKMIHWEKVALGE